jgi:hypothetical protein
VPSKKCEPCCKPRTARKPEPLRSTLLIFLA